MLCCRAQVDRHPNLRLAYVAQHAFHHLEESLDISPVRYILRRYLGGEDKEESQKVHRTYTEEEWEKVRKQVSGIIHNIYGHLTGYSFSSMIA